MKDYTRYLVAFSYSTGLTVAMWVYNFTHSDCEIEWVIAPRPLLGERLEADLARRMPNVMFIDRPCLIAHSATDIICSHIITVVEGEDGDITDDEKLS